MGCGADVKEPIKLTRQFSAVSNEIVDELGNARELQNYRFQKILGHGRDGRVLLAQDKRDGKLVAIKVLERKGGESALAEEVQMLAQVDHPSIVKYYTSFQTAKYLYIVMEYCSGGDLFDKALEQGKFSESEAASIITEILRGINHCHHRGLVHRDIKPENIMISAEGKIKIIDFGLSMMISRRESGRLVGTPYYIAPEVINGEGYENACDMWSIGIILHILLSGYVPIDEAETQSMVFDNIKAYKGPRFNGKMWVGVSENAKDLVRKMLEPDPKKRISAADALHHTWLCHRSLSSDSLATCDPGIIDSLRKYSGFSKLKKRALNLLVQNLTEQDIQKFEELFLRLDTQQTGMITCADLEACLKQEGFTMTAQELEKLTRQVNYEGEAFINYSDFLAATLSAQQFFTEEKLWSLFQTMDTDRNGCITTSDLRTVLCNRKRVFSTELEDIMNGAGCDGKITFDEFKKVITNSP